MKEEDSRPADVFKCFLKSHQRSGPLNDNIDCPDRDCDDENPPKTGPLTDNIDCPDIYCHDDEDEVDWLDPQTFYNFEVSYLSFCVAFGVSLY